MPPVSSSVPKIWLAIALLWLGGVGLRLTILAIPPVVPAIQQDLGLAGTQIGILNALPIVLFALAALPGSLLIAHLGALRTLVHGLVLAGIGSALRAAMPDVWVLFAGTIAMGAGIAIMQPALPALVRQWLPSRIGFGSAVVTNGLLVGETLPVALMLPLVVPLAGGWRGALALWAIPMFVIALLIVLSAPRQQIDAPGALPRWWPDWRSGLTWKLGFIISSVNSIYFCTNAFLPGYLAGAGRSDLISASLTSLNLAQIPASLLLLVIANRLVGRAWPYVVTGIVMLAALVGLVTTASMWTVVFAGVLGFVGAVVLTLCLALPALLSAPGDVARTAAAMFTIGYTTAVVVAIVSGAAWDLTGDPRWAFLPIALSGLPQLLLARTARTSAA
jgi:CP family cyanate transporter-like MFS transporter